MTPSYLKARDEAAKEFASTATKSNPGEDNDIFKLIISSNFSQGSDFGYSQAKEEAKGLEKLINGMLDTTDVDWDCGDSFCRFAKKKGGMRTNGGCHCHEFNGAKVLEKRLFDLVFQYRSVLKAVRKEDA